MIHLGHIDNQRAALALSDYFTTQKLDHQVKIEHGHQHHFYVNSLQLTQAQQIFDDFCANPNQEKYLSASWQTNSPFKTSGSLGISKIWQSAGWFTKTIFILCCAIYLASIAGYFETLFLALGFQWIASEPYRLFTPAIMHLSALHLVFNLSWWWYLGRQVESAFGAQRLFTLLLMTAITSNICQALIVNPAFAGLSGVVYGLVGYCWLAGKLNPSGPIHLGNNIMVFLLVWMGLGFVELLPVNMANWAHLGGLLSGLVLALLFNKAKSSSLSDTNT